MIYNLKKKSKKNRRDQKSRVRAKRVRRVPKGMKKQERMFAFAKMILRRINVSNLTEADLNSLSGKVRLLVFENCRKIHHSNTFSSVHVPSAIISKLNISLLNWVSKHWMDLAGASLTGRTHSYQQTANQTRKGEDGEKWGEERAAGGIVDILLWSTTAITTSHFRASSRATIRLRPSRVTLKRIVHECSRNSSVRIFQEKSSRSTYVSFWIHIHDNEQYFNYSSLDSKTKISQALWSIRWSRGRRTRESRRQERSRRYTLHTNVLFISRAQRSERPREMKRCISWQAIPISHYSSLSKPLFPQLYHQGG